MMKKIEKIVLPYSGGLDTSIILKWLQETYRCEIIADWRIDYNLHRPHTSLGGLTPNEFTTRSAMDHNVNRPKL